MLICRFSDESNMRNEGKIIIKNYELTKLDAMEGKREYNVINKKGGK